MTDVRLDSLSFVVGLLWGVHPITTAAVTYAVQRYESLAACFIIWSCFYWIQAVHANAAGASRARSRWWSWGLSMLFALLAMGSKETAAGLPLILILYSLLASKSMKSDWRLFIGPLLLLMIVIVAGYLRAPYLLKPNNRVGTIGFGLVGIDAVEYISTQPLIYLRYLKLLVWPSDLVLDYGWIPSLFNRWIVVGQLIWLGIIVVMGVLVRWQPVAAWLLSSCLLILSVTSFIPTQDMIFEHRFYLPSALLIGLVVFTADRYLPERLTIARLLGFTAIAIALSYATIARNFDYTSAAELATKDLERVPNNPRNYARWGAEVADERNPMMLEETLETAIEMAKERGYFHSGLNFAWRLRLADLLYLRGEIVEARRWYEEALEESHSELQTVQVLMPLAIIASMEGRDEEAERLFEEALEVDTPMREQVELSYRTHLSRKSSGVGLAPTPKS
ncbi:MAG: tetratricopeptide repeat protein [Planctomycetota bacterium]